ncbi:MAG: hypothetical protein IT377_24795 [Polyangiaceae bacterium]|nr:hypothetical protein [Myxococcales bacterium]MCC6902213.1 hypothetical protein [Polyangiaceae bacterium]
MSSPALAEDKQPAYGAAPAAELPKSLRLPASMLAQVGADRDQGPPRGKKVKRTRTDCNQNGCGYKALLGGITIAKDIQASEDVSVRVIPTTNSLGGEASTPIVVRARVDGQYGLHLRAKF